MLFWKCKTKETGRDFSSEPIFCHVVMWPNLFSPWTCMVTSSIICCRAGLWFPFQRLVSSISRIPALSEAAFKWQWYIWHITKTKGLQGPVFLYFFLMKPVTRLFCRLVLATPHKKFTGVGNPEASWDLASRDVCKDPIKMHYRKWDLGEPCEKPCM